MRWLSRRSASSARTRDARGEPRSTRAHFGWPHRQWRFWLAVKCKPHTVHRLAHIYALREQREASEVLVSVSGDDDEDEDEHVSAIG